MKAAELGRDLRIFLASACVSGLLSAACGSDPEPASETDDSGAGTTAVDDSAGSSGEPNRDDFVAAYAVMQDRCAECHTAGTPHSFIVDDNIDVTLESAFAARSKIQMRVIEPEVPSDRMPPNGPLTSEQLAAIEDWLAGL